MVLHLVGYGNFSATTGRKGVQPSLACVRVLTMITEVLRIVLKWQQKVLRIVHISHSEVLRTVLEGVIAFCIRVDGVCGLFDSFLSTRYGIVLANVVNR